MQTVTQLPCYRSCSLLTFFSLCFVPNSFPRKRVLTLLLLLLFIYVPFFFFPSTPPFSLKLVRKVYCFVRETYKKEKYSGKTQEMSITKKLVVRLMKACPFIIENRSDIS